VATLPLNKLEYTMKSYQVELKRVSYVNMDIEAESQDEAEALAWIALESHGSYGEDASWELESVAEVTA
jgi:hypothetical protein